MRNLYNKLRSAVVEENKGALRKQVLSESCIEEKIFVLGPEGCLSWKDTVEKTTLELRNHQHEHSHGKDMKVHGMVSRFSDITFWAMPEVFRKMLLL